MIQFDRHIFSDGLVQPPTRKKVWTHIFWVPWKVSIFEIPARRISMPRGGATKFACEKNRSCWERKKKPGGKFHTFQKSFEFKRDPCKDDPLWYMLLNSWTNPTMTRPNARDAGNMIWQIPSVPSSDVLTWTSIPGKDMKHEWPKNWEGNTLVVALGVLNHVMSGWLSSKSGFFEAFKNVFLIKWSVCSQTVLLWAQTLRYILRAQLGPCRKTWVMRATTFEQWNKLWLSMGF